MQKRLEWGPASIAALALLFIATAGIAMPAVPQAAGSALQIAHGPTMPPYPWEEVQIAHGPTMPPYPWEE